jgi:hypothetical protein
MPALPTIIFIGGAVFITVAMLSQAILTPYYRILCPDLGMCHPRDVEFAMAERAVFILLAAAVINSLCVSGLTPIAWGVIAAVFAALVYSMKIHTVI